MQDIFIEDVGSGTPLVLVHGFLGSSEMWTLQTDFFKRNFRVLAPALPGFGKSNKVKSCNSIESMAKSILTSLEKKKIERFYLLGHSMGGMIVQEMVKLTGEKILKLINKKTKVIISIFAGRAGDTGKDPVPEFKKSIEIAKKFKNVEILWASVREPYNYLQAKQLGCHIITIPPTTIEKIENFGKTFDQLTKETVKAFLDDSKKSRFKI